MKRLLLLLALLCAGDARADFNALASPGPLAEAHKDLDGKCDKCHVPFKGIPSSACLSCHADTKKRIDSGVGTHAQFEQAGKKCSACHGDHKGRKHALSPPVAAAFEHTVTGFILDGKHRQAACGGCHKPGPSGPRWVGLPSACSGCHADVHKGTLGDKCAACHSASTWKPPTKTLAAHKVPMTGGHAGLACAQCHEQGAHLVATSSCGDCHAQKHGGTKAPCATCHNVDDWKSATFTHDFCTCILPGKHQTAPCLSCHKAFVFNPTPFACAACHKKDLKHEDLGACARCHSALSWKQKAFDHNKPRVGFPLAGAHLVVACESCHTKKGVFSGAPRNCEGCHKVPKHGDFGACAKCHSVVAWDKPSFSHDSTQFPLDGQHRKATCEGCHAKFAKGSFVRGPNACLLCHRNPHDGQFGEPRSTPHALLAPFPPGLVLLAANGAHVVSPRLGCMDCHTSARWKPSTVDLPTHATFRYPLVGAHQTVPCARCHEGGVFVGTPMDCKSCHLDRHRGRVGMACERCHDESGWKHHPSFDHAAATGFPLEGAHDGVACAECHGKDHQKLATVQKVGCATCHTPRHGAQFGDHCERCHKPTKFSDVPPFEHEQTMFPLDRRHRAVPCLACHDVKRGARLTPECRSCHEDPHRGRALLDCNECHRADRFSLVRFDHDRTEFPLRGRHFATPCRECHTNDQFTGVRSECVSCHRGDRQRADSLHVDHRAFGFDCSDCHRPFNW